jgi:hypothetical protein
VPERPSDTQFLDRVAEHCSYEGELTREGCAPALTVEPAWFESFLGRCGVALGEAKRHAKGGASLVGDGPDVRHRAIQPRIARGTIIRFGRDGGFRADESAKALAASNAR